MRTRSFFLLRSAIGAARSLLEPRDNTAIMKYMLAVQQPNHLALHECFYANRTLLCSLPHLHLFDALNSSLAQAKQLLLQVVLLESELDRILEHESVKLLCSHAVDGRLFGRIVLIVVGVDNCLVLVLPVDEVEVVLAVGVHLDRPVRHALQQIQCSQLKLSKLREFTVLLLGEGELECQLIPFHLLQDLLGGSLGVFMASVERLVDVEVDGLVQVDLLLIHKDPKRFRLHFTYPQVLRLMMELVVVLKFIDHQMLPTFTFPISVVQVIFLLLSLLALACCAELSLFVVVRSRLGGDFRLLLMEIFQIFAEQRLLLSLLAD